MCVQLHVRFGAQLNRGTGQTRAFQGGKMTKLERQRELTKDSLEIFLFRDQDSGSDQTCQKNYPRAKGHCQFHPSSTLALEVLH